MLTKGGLAFGAGALRNRIGGVGCGESRSEDGADVDAAGAGVGDHRGGEGIDAGGLGFEAISHFEQAHLGHRGGLDAGFGGHTGNAHHLRGRDADHDRFAAFFVAH